MSNLMKPRSRLAAEPAGGSAQSAPRVVHSALERLGMIKAHQLSFRDELARNWQGWLGSLVLHVGVFVLCAAMVHSVVNEKTDYGPEIGPMSDSDPELSRVPIEDLPEVSHVDSAIDSPPSVDSGGRSPGSGYNDQMPGEPPWITSRGYLKGGDGDGGGPFGDRLGGKPFGTYIGGIQRTGLEVVFCFDSTGSMGGIILESKTRIRQLIKVITYLVPNARIGITTYRDWKKYDLDDYEYTVKYVPLVKCNKEGVDKLHRFLRETEAYGGGDIPEAIQAGLETTLEKSGWTPGTKKIIIIFGDAPPHPEDNGLAKTYDMCRKFHDKDGGVISCIDTTGGSKLMEEFRQMAAEGGGEATFLNDERAIIKQLAVMTFGTKWEKPIEDVFKQILKGPEDTVLSE